MDEISKIISIVISLAAFTLIISNVSLMNLAPLSSSSHSQVRSITSTGSLHQPSKCLSVQNDFTQLVEKMEQIFITFPAKAAGTSLKKFTADCMEEPTHSNFLSNQELKEEMLTSKYDNPRIITSHMTKHGTDLEPNAMVKLANGVTDSTLIIYVHRHETDRLVSAISQVAWRFCGEFFRQDVSTVFQKYDDDSIQRQGERNCIIKEDVVIDMMKRRIIEIGHDGAQDVWTCETFDAVAESRPNIVFLHYKQADKLQSVLGKKFCPDRFKEMHQNVGEEKSIQTFVRLASDNKTEVSLKEWAKTKARLLEWSLDLYKDGSCRGKMRDIEKELFACKDETLLISSV